MAKNLTVTREPETDDSELILNEFESDQIINTLKDELIMENILEQVKYPLDNDVDYLDIFETRYRYLSDVYKDSTMFIEKLNNVKDAIYSELFTAIVKKFNFSYTDNTLDINQCAKDLYNFFILDYKENLIQYFINTILLQKKSLALSLSDPQYSKKVGVNALKKLLKHREDAIIISNINTVIQSIISNSTDNLELIKTMVADDIDEVSNYHVYQYFLNDFTIAPNSDFNDRFFDIIKNKREGYSAIINEVKILLLNLAPKKDK